MPARVTPAAPPYSPEVEAFLDRMMPQGVAPLVLFTTMARDGRLFARFTGGGLLDRGHLSLRQREIVIARVTARCRSEYEWGVHAAIFGERVGFTAEHLDAVVHGGADAPCWSAEDALLIRFCDSLEARCDVDDELWRQLSQIFSEMALVELLMLAGFYRTVSYLTNALRLPPESFAPRFPDGTFRDLSPQPHCDSPRGD